ncbi:acyl-CoA dehydrogenase family protein [Parvibaculum sp.]|uniref:acyl-CoA dehydrogenase family protein n=1 Tax=Parvibaculum sp. TaxID=2024848 RepID=UPI001D5BF0B4|nr:acyl-CoA dehydrogenase family protein [Parvibaculum sp.]MBX3489084.1 acyl-CoA dehydrogenase family protein [Parvibaculum sp.]MCW5727047.1 acyl-CoA dehydrogenase family protein [Parvibaculum sp.]
MELGLGAKDAAFRDEVRRFLDEKLTPELRETGKLMTSVYADYETTMTWHKALYEKGWVAPAWPVEHGGCDWSVVQHYIFSSELAAAGAPSLSPMGLGMCGPVLIGYGTPEQKAHYLPRILNGEDFWCQGYSEPGSGSDLASLQMSAVEDGDDFICNGQKIWTTHANYANRIFNLVRTSKEDIPQRGITFILIDMDTPGVKVEPLIMLSGEHIQNQIFFTDVRVPKKNVVGKVGDGWTVAKYLMQFERGGHAYAPGLHNRLARIRRMAENERGGDGTRLIDDTGFAAKLAAASVEITALEYTEHRIMSALSHGQAPGAESSLLKTRGTEVSQRLTELALEAVAHYALPFQPHATRPGGPVPGVPKPTGNEKPVGPEHSWPVTPKYLNDRAGSIYAGTNEIQRNIMAKAVLGL